MLRTHPWLKHSWIIFAPERNNGLAGHLDEVISSIPCAYTLSDGTGSSRSGNNVRGSPGINTNETTKNLYARCLRQELNKRNVCFLRDFVVCDQPSEEASHSGFKSIDERRFEVKEEAIAQLERCRPVVKKRASDFSPMFVGWSGKCDDEGNIVPGLNDDIAVGFAGAAFVLRGWEKQAFPTVPWNALLRAILRTRP